MSEEIKYEMIFGDQELFDGSPSDCVIAIVRPFIEGVRRREVYFFKSVFDAIVKAGSDFNFNNVIMRDCDFAMRRIIQEPKRWTVEDQKAGRLPEVVAEFQTSNGKRKCVITEGKFIFTVNDDAVEVYTIESAMPLETPEEKHERLKSEWVELVRDKALISADEYTVEAMYDAFISGALSVPTKDSE